jgi:hypothetical protein
MTAIYQSINGKLLSGHGAGALLIGSSFTSIYLRYGLTEKDTGRVVIPEVLLDDWGHEKGSIDLYSWIQENGDHFPRAEIFGFDLEGHQRQYLLRELDLMARYPCFGFPDLEMGISEGVRIEIIMTCSEELIKPHRVSRSQAASWPLRNAAVSWYMANILDASEFAHSIIDERAGESHPYNDL